jgi:DNA polymerase III subunit epsilon
MQTYTLEASAIATLAAAIAPDNKAAQSIIKRLEAQSQPTPNVTRLAGRLARPIIFFDLETTGTDTSTSKIVELVALKLAPNGETVKHEVLINPGCLIPAGASAVHGIYNSEEDAHQPGYRANIANAPFFTDIAEELHQFFNGCDLAGYNSNRFDIPLLAEEFNRCCGYPFPFPGTLMLDAFTIYSKNERRTLTDALRFYTGKALDNAHEASADVAATITILEAQLSHYQELNEATLEELHQLSKANPKQVDLAGKLALDEAGAICWTFGKHAGQPISTDYGYIEWVLGGNFPSETKSILQDWLIKDAASV